MTAAQHPGRVVVAGSFNVDHVWSGARLPQPGETLSGHYSSGPGGKGFNQAVACRRAGADTSFICALGDDAGARLAHELASADGLQMHAHASKHPTGTAGILVDADGRNSIVIGPGANADLDADVIGSHADLVTSAQVVLTQLEISADAVTALLGHARDAGAFAILNPAPADAATMPQMLALATLITPNESEFAAMLHRHCDTAMAADAVAGSEDARLHALCRRLLPGGSVIITLGAAGSFVSHGERRHGDGQPFYRVAATAAQVVDTTGAGDAFNGALAASLAASLAEPAQAPFSSHVEFASRYAARSTERAGAALAMPHRAEITA